MPVIFHVDMDAFFASIEQRDHPEYRGKPVIVGAKPGSRGVVCAASYEARVFGVRSALPISQAYARCPHGIFVRPRMTIYSQQSHALMEILRSYSPLVEPISVDEAFVDMTGTEKLWGPGESAAQKIGEQIRTQMQLTASIGMAPNKFLAKLASDCNKPNGITMTPFVQTEIEAWLAPMPVRRIWGVGAKTEEVLAQWGIRSIGQLQALTLDELQRRFGQTGSDLYALCRGLDQRTVGGSDPAKSISRENTFEKDCADPAEWRKVLLSLSLEVARQARSEGVRGRTVFLTYRTPDFNRHTRRVTLSAPTQNGKTIYETVCALLDTATKSIRRFRLIGVGITNFSGIAQTSLFDDTRSDQAWEASDQAIDTLMQKFGDGTVVRGGEL